MSRQARAPRYKRFRLKFKEGIDWDTIFNAVEAEKMKIKTIQLIKPTNEHDIILRRPRSEKKMYKVYSYYTTHVIPTLEHSDALVKCEDEPLYIYPLSYIQNKV